MDYTHNFAYSHVATAPSPADSGTSLVVTTGDGSGAFPVAPFNVVIWPTGEQPLGSNSEIARVTLRVEDTFTIVRTQEFGNNRSVVAGDQVAAMVTKKMLIDLRGEPREIVSDSFLIDGNVLGWGAVVVDEYIMDDTYELTFGDLSELAVI